MSSETPCELSDLILRAKQGCSASLGQLLEMYRSYLRLISSFQMSRQMLEKFSPSDIVQGTFLQAHRRFTEFQGGTERELIAWLRKILASHMGMEIRKYTARARDVRVERRLQQQLDQSSLVLAGVFSASTESPSQTASRRERAVILANALSQLPANYREVIVLRHLRAYRFSEVAAEMNQSVDSVRAMWRRAIKRLRELLGDNVL